MKLSVTSTSSSDSFSPLFTQTSQIMNFKSLLLSSVLGVTSLFTGVGELQYLIVMISMVVITLYSLGNV